MTTSLAVAAINANKRYGQHNVNALNDVTLEIRSGEFVALMGPSGCGKSTLLNCIGGLDVLSSGQVVVDGADLSTFTEQQLTELRRDKVGFVFQFFNLLSTLTVKENITVPLELAGRVSTREIEQRAEALLQEMGLTERANFYPSQLSGGEMQRTAIARAVIHRPQIVLADEPTGNLDTDNGIAVLKLLQSISKSRGETVLMATHSSEAAEYADRVIRMKDGRVLQPSPS